MEHPDWHFGVAIAFNLCLTGLNVYVLWKLPRWRRKLWHLRQKITMDERQITTDLEQARQGIALLPEAANSLVAKKQQVTNSYKKVQLVLQVYKFLTAYRRKF